MKLRIIIVFSLLTLFYCGTAQAANFSLYGVKMGMSKSEVDKLWTPLESGEYVVKDAPLFGLVPTFDFQYRLFKLSFMAPIEKKYPSNLVTSAFQKVVQQMWGDDPTVSLSTRTGRGSIEVTVISKTLQEDLVNHIMVQIGSMFRP